MRRPPLRICRCGVHAPDRPGSCEHCGTARPGHVQVVPAVELAFAGLQLAVACPRCAHHRVPIEELTDEVRCTRCRGSVPLDPSIWRAVLATAHATADLLGPHPEGREPSRVAIDVVNPFAEAAREGCGVTFDPDERTWSGWLPDTVYAWVTSGRPRGPETLEPLDVEAGPPGTVRATTPGGDDARYSIDPIWLARHPGLVGVVAEEHRADLPFPRLDPDSDDPRCPSCGEVLGVDGALPRVRCGHCGTVSHVPARLRHLRQPGGRAGLWWLVFRGASPHRRVLERATGAGPDDRAIEPLPEAPIDSWTVLANVSLVIAVPTSLLLVAGLAVRASGLASWLPLWVQGP